MYRHVVAVSLAGRILSTKSRGERLCSTKVAECIGGLWLSAVCLRQPSRAPRARRAAAPLRTVLFGPKSHDECEVRPGGGPQLREL